MFGFIAPALEVRQLGEVIRGGLRIVSLEVVIIQ